MGLDLQTWQLLAIHCPNLKQLTIGFEGGEESVYDSASFYSSQLTDLSLQIVAQCCPRLRWAAPAAATVTSRKDLYCCCSELHPEGSCSSLSGSACVQCKVRESCLASTCLVECLPACAGVGSDVCILRFQ